MPTLVRALLLPCIVEINSCSGCLLMSWLGRIALVDKIDDVLNTASAQLTCCDPSLMATVCIMSHCWVADINPLLVSL